MAVYFGMQMLTGYLKGPQQAVTTKDSTGAVVTVPNNNGPIPSYWERPASLDEGASYSAVPHRIAPIWPLDSAMDVTIVVSPTFVHEPLDRVSAERKVVQEKSFKMSDKKDKRVVDTSFEMPKEVRNNGTLWGHFYVALSGKPLDPSAHSYDPASAYHFVRPLTQYLTKKKVVKTKNLLASNTTVEEEPEEDPKQRLINSFYHPNFTMSFVPDSGVMNYQSLHPAVKQYVTLDQTAARDGSGLNGWYYPVLFVNTFWQLRSQMTELNNTVTRVPFHVDLNTQANWLFSIISSIDEGNKAQQRQIAAGQPLPAGGDGSEFEMFKEILLDSNMYLLITTAVASVLHMIFEMLAFKNDISHYRNKKDNVGISVRSILGNVFMQTVIFLYLLDNNENTSWMILFGQGMGIAIELWKITTVVNIRVLPAPPGSWFPYTVKFEDKHVLSDTEEKTKEYDAIAFKYLYIIAVPLLIAYAIYSLMYDTHKSWYSFIITTLVGSVYAYGFLMMVPSLYINYRLKSVAHMPRKAMVYKFLNTFIDGKSSSVPGRRQ
jgi:hypothetical protein